MVYAIPRIYQFLLENRINFQSKVSGTVRADLFCLRVEILSDAKRVIAFCNSDKAISDNYGYTNPFLSHVDGIGIARDTYKISYNMYLVDMLLKYCKETKSKNIRKSWLSKDFEQYVLNLYQAQNSSKTRFLIGVLYQNLHAINNDNNILDYMQDKFNYVIVSSYGDYKVNELLPYLYADVAMRYKELDEFETSLVLNAAKNNLKIANVDTSIKNVYSVNGENILTSVPAISVGGRLLLIEFLDNGLYNFTLVGNDNNSMLYNVPFNIDRERLIADLDYRIKIGSKVVAMYYCDSYGVSMIK